MVSWWTAITLVVIAIIVVVFDLGERLDEFLFPVEKQPPKEEEPPEEEKYPPKKEKQPPSIPLPPYERYDDPQLAIKSANDPYVNAPNNYAQKWLVELPKCTDYMRGQHDNDRWWECPTYYFPSYVRILINEPEIGERYNYTKFEGKKFSHVWQDLNENLRVDETDYLEEVHCNVLETDNWGFNEKQPNGNRSTGLYYCPQLKEHFYAVNMVYIMKGDSLDEER